MTSKRLYHCSRYGNLLILKAAASSTTNTVRQFRLLVDTGSTYTVLRVNILEALDCDIKNPLRRIRTSAGSGIRPLAKKIYVIIKDFKFNPPKLTHNCKLLTTNYNADHNGDGDSDNDSTIF